MQNYQAAPVSALTVRCELGESPLWLPSTGLLWLDVPGQRLHIWDCNEHVTTVPLAHTVTAVVPTAERNLLAVTSTGFALLDPESGHLHEVAQTTDGHRATMNDAAIDAQGRCWAGSAVRDDTGGGALYRLERGQLTKHLDGLGMSNGLDWSSQNDILYHVDTTAGTVTAWDFHDASGELSTFRVLRKIPAEVGLPDGLTVDAADNIWLAVWGAGEVWCLSRYSGETLATVRVPTPFPTSCVFGGPNLSTLYITTANYVQSTGGGLLYAAYLPVRGRNPKRYVGA